MARCSQHEAADVCPDAPLAPSSQLGRDNDLVSLVRLLAGIRLTPHIGLRSSWADTNAALDAFAAGRVDGKAVLDVHA
jgi:D-arabinose 1-dehydrogenase-like Zn-dependent alcohol dehydrogenase